MKLRHWLIPISGALLASLWSIAAHADADKVVIGDIDDMSGLYADINGPGAVEAIKMAIADFGGSALGQPVELLTSDHQNKPDLGVQKFREWADRDGLTMMLGGANTGVSPRHSCGREGKEGSVLRHRGHGRLADRQGLHALHRALRLRHDRARQRHRNDHSQRGRQDVVLPYCRLRLRLAIARRRRAGRHREWRNRRRLCARAARDFGFRLLPLAGAEFGRAGARPRQCGPRLHELAEGGQRPWRSKDDEAGRPSWPSSPTSTRSAWRRRKDSISQPHGIGISTTRPAPSPSASWTRSGASRP